MFVLGLENNPTNVLVTTAIGKNYRAEWETYSLPSWKSYAEKHGLGILCISDDLVPQSSSDYKNGSWQKMLAPRAILDLYPFVERICLMDTDISIGPFAENVFAESPEGQYSIVSQLTNLPFPLEEVLRRVAFFRHHFFSEEYPLDSFLLGNLFEEFTDLGLPAPEDYFCAGLIVLDRQHADQMHHWFFEESESQNTHGWEQTHLNHWIQREQHHWLPYEYQALWNYEMAWKYPFLYSEARGLEESIKARECVESSLWNNHFLHFAGSWFENLAWKAASIRSTSGPTSTYREFEQFRDQPVSGRKWGQIFPST